MNFAKESRALVNDVLAKICCFPGNNDRWCLLSAHSGPRTIRNASLECTNWISLFLKCYFYSHFTGKKARHKEIEWSKVTEVKKERPEKLCPEPLYLTTRKCYHLEQREETCSGCLDFLAKYKSSVMQSNRSNIVLLIHSLCYNLYTMAQGNRQHIRWGLLPGSLRFITYIWWRCVWNIPLMYIFLVR